MGVQSFVLISPFFFFLCHMGALIYFHTLCKNCYKMQMCSSIASIIGTNEEHVMVDSLTKFAVNLSVLKKIKLLSQLQGKPSIGIT